MGETASSSHNLMEYTVESTTSFFSSPCIHISKSSIGNILHSDHAPIHCDLSLANSQCKSLWWKLNKTLLSDALCLSGLKKEDFHERSHRTPDTVGLSKEALFEEALLRGILIKYGSRIKREALFKIEKLTNKLQHLEMTYASTQSESYLRELIQVRHEIL